MHWKIKTIIIILISAILIGYPFFALKFFETELPLKITLIYFLPPILIILIAFGPKFYFRKVKKLDNFQTKSILQDKIRDIFAIFMMILCSSGVLFGVFFSLIVTTNCFSGTEITIKEPVLDYRPEITKNGRLRHYIDIINPKTKNKIHLEVYREYSDGELFKKEMKYGLWGILYSKK
jgi:ABC-type maltose transport system permease subunit